LYWETCSSVGGRIGQRQLEVRALRELIFGEDLSDDVAERELREHPRVARLGEPREARSERRSVQRELALHPQEAECRDVTVERHRPLLGKLDDQARLRPDDVEELERPRVGAGEVDVRGEGPAEPLSGLEANGLRRLGDRA
jgi:hypothetical protein